MSGAVKSYSGGIVGTFTGDSGGCGGGNWAETSGGATTPMSSKDTVRRVDRDDGG